MGADYYAYVAYGFKAKASKVYDVVTKYDENTGKPYEKQVERTAAIIGRHVLNEEETEQVFCGEGFEDLDVIPVTDYEEVIIGYQMSDIGDLNCALEAKEFFPEKVPNKEKIEKVASKYDVKVGYFLVPYCSY